MTMFPTTALAVAAGLALANPASANLISDFTGTCTAVCTGPVTGVLTLTDAYVPGTPIQGLGPDAFVEFNLPSLAINWINIGVLPTNPAYVSVTGGLNADGSLTEQNPGLVIQRDPVGDSLPSFSLANDVWHLFTSNGFGPGPGDQDNPFTGTGSFGPLHETPEPATLAILGVGLLGLAAASRLKAPT